jgi:hypothetical protein
MLRIGQIIVRNIKVGGLKTGPAGYMGNIPSATKVHRKRRLR